ncbi:PilN domain-containing protein [Gilvimarinus sp. DA14]|uniref:PilN domain-containing protein n=1 Tax=Gilvimarinus sp. DA14 TaxID=2956798 RepID=UPI0020B7AF2C|nr:PilN domain-containing protein [Gilvimarinus sp. DA14]UTF59835.1 PilN domain-containing protein [Gilvimarinus sp. DA14]
MSEQTSQWVLFGYDLRGLWQSFRGAWREVFWAQGAPLRELIDEPVALKSPDGTTELKGRGSGNIAATAILLPDSMVLSKSLIVPRMAGIAPSSVVANEVVAASPFGADDTAFGWRVLDSDASKSVIGVAIVSKSAVMNHVHQSRPEAAVNSIEVWSVVGDQYIVLSGFGEHERNSRYRRRLQKVAVLVSLASLSVLLSVAVPVTYKYYDLASTQAAYYDIQQQAKEIVELRTSLANVNRYIDELNSTQENVSNPMFVLNLLSERLPDDAWLTSFEQEGDSVTIDGIADNGATLMQEISQYPSVQNVRAVSGIRKVGNNDEKERYSFAFTVAEGTP